MNLADELAQLEARLRDAEQKLEGERRRNDMQAGALRESRAENAALREQLERVSKGHGELVQLFRTVYGTSERLSKTEEQIAAHELNGAQATPSAAPKTLRGKLSRLRAKAEAAA